MVWVWRMITEILWLPSNGGIMLDGNQIFSITIQHTPSVRWQPKFFGCQEKGACHMILEKNVKGFPKTYDIHPFPSD